MEDREAHRKGALTSYAKGLHDAAKNITKNVRSDFVGLTNHYFIAYRETERRNSTIVVGSVMLFWKEETSCCSGKKCRVSAYFYWRNTLEQHFHATKTFSADKDDDSVWEQEGLILNSCRC